MATKVQALAPVVATTFIGGTLALSAANTTTDAMTATAHGKSTGFGPVRLTNAGGALPAGLATATNYWLVVVDANTVKFATTEANAIASTPVVVDITGTGTGTHAMQATMQTLFDLVEDCTNEVFGTPGNRVGLLDSNQSKLWDYMLLASF